MIFDRTLQFSNAQAITADAPSTNVIDLGAAGTAFGHAAALGRDLGAGVPIPLLCQVVEAFNNLTSLEFQLQGSTDEVFTSPLIIARSGAIALASLTLGYQWKQDWFPRSGLTYRYVRFYYDVTGSAPTLGKVTAGVVAAIQPLPAPIG